MKPWQTFSCLMRTHYCWLDAFKKLWRETVPAEFILLLCLNALQHPFLRRRGKKKKNLDCNCSFAPVSMKMDFQMWISLHLSLPATCPPPNLIWTRTLLLYSHDCYAPHYVVKWKKPTKSLFRYPSKKGWFSGRHYNNKKGDLVHIHLNFPKIIEVLFIDLLLFLFQSI